MIKSKTYQIALDENQCTLLSSFAEVRYRHDEKTAYISQLNELDTKKSEDGVVFSGQWNKVSVDIGVTGMSREICYVFPEKFDADISAHYDKIAIDHDKDCAPKISAVGIVFEDRSFHCPDACKVAKALKWSLSKARRVINKSLGMLRIYEFNRKSRHHGYIVTRHFFGVPQKVQKALLPTFLSGESFEGRYTADDLPVIQWLHEQTEEMTEAYDNNDGWRPRFHPKQVSEELGISEGQAWRSMRRLTGLLCNVREDHKRRHHLGKRMQLNAWMLPEARESLAYKILADVGLARPYSTRGTQTTLEDI